MPRIIYNKYRWFILATMIAVNVVTVIILVSPVTLIGEIAGTLDLGLGGTTGVTMVAINIFVILSAMVGGNLVDKFGPYLVWVAGLCMLITGSLLTLVIGSSVHGMILVRFIQGFGVGPIMATTPLVVSHCFEKEKRAVVIGVQAAFVPVGAILAMSFVPMVFTYTGRWQTAMASTSIFCALALLLSFLAYLLPKPLENNYNTDNDLPDAGPYEIKMALMQPATWSVALCSFCFSWTLRVFYDLLTGYLAVSKPVGVGLGPLKAGILMSGVNIATIIGTLLSGIVVERIFRGRPRGLVIIGFIVPAVLWYSIQFQGVLSNRLILTLFLWLGGFALSMGEPMPMSFIARVYPEKIMGKVTGLLIGTSSLGVLTGLGAGTISLQVTGDYDVAINLVGIGAFTGFLSALFLKAPDAYLERGTENVIGDNLTPLEADSRI